MRVEYKHIRDPLFVAAIILYCVNKLMLLRYGLMGGTFFESYLSDILMIPILLPILIWVVSKAGWRDLGTRPTHWEILATLIPVILVCEYIGPIYLRRGVADPLDILAYAAGGFVSWLYWNHGGRSISGPETAAGGAM